MKFKFSSDCATEVEDDLVVVYCLLKSGNVFPNCLNADDVATSVLDEFDVELAAHEGCEAGQLYWAFQCAAANLEHFVD